MKKIQILFLLFVMSLCGKAFSQTWTPHNTGILNDIFDISFPTNDSGYAMDGTGQIEKTFDGAVSWSVVTPPATVFCIRFVSGKTGFVAGDSTIYRTTNAGSSWTQVMNDNQVAFVSIYFVDALNGFAAGFKFANDSLRLYKTSNGGITWSYVSSLFSNLPDQAFYFFNSTTGFWSNNFEIFSTTNGGASFNSVHTSQTDIMENISFPNIDTGYAVGYYGELVRSIDGGANWSLITYPGTVNYDLHFLDGRKGFICGGNGINSGYVMQTSNGGASWTLSYTSIYTFGSMDFPSDTIGYAGGQNGLVLRYSDLPNGISENQTTPVINIFPNPATNSVEINNVIPGSKIFLLDLSGQIIKQEIAENNGIKINLGDVTKGIYFVQTVNEGKVSTQKLILY